MLNLYWLLFSFAASFWLVVALLDIFTKLFDVDDPVSYVYVSAIVTVLVLTIVIFIIFTTT